MAKKPMFMPAPSGDHYLINLAGVLLISGDAIYGDPTETTPQGRANAQRMVDRILSEATARGFKHGDAILALMEKNQPCARLQNLAREAMDCIPKDVQGRIMSEELSAGRERIAAAPKQSNVFEFPRGKPQATSEPLAAELEAVDPRFWAAGAELKRIADAEGPDAIHKTEHAHLFASMMKHAPARLKTDMEAWARELGLMPKVTHVTHAGAPIFSAAQIAEKHGVSVEEVESLIAMLLAKGDIDPCDLYTGVAHPLQ